MEGFANLRCMLWCLSFTSVDNPLDGDIVFVTNVAITGGYGEGHDIALSGFSLVGLNGAALEIAHIIEDYRARSIIDLQLLVSDVVDEAISAVPTDNHVVAFIWLHTGKGIRNVYSHMVISTIVRAYPHTLFSSIRHEEKLKLESTDC